MKDDFRVMKIDPKLFEEITIYKVWVNGVKDPLFATEKQVELIASYSNNLATRQNMVKLGKDYFRISNVTCMKEVKMQRSYIPSYATQKYDEEINGLRTI